MPELVCPLAVEDSRNITVHCVSRMSYTSTFTGSNLKNHRYSIQCNSSTCTQPPGVEVHVKTNSTHVDTVMLIDVVRRSHGGEWECSNTFSIGPLTSNRSCQMNIYGNNKKNALATVGKLINIFLKYVI